MPDAEKEELFVVAFGIEKLGNTQAKNLQDRNYQH